MNATGRRLALAKVLLFSLALGAPLAASAQAVKLTVGYQPYDTISYSAVVIRGLELWKKHLPPGSTVEFESALQGAIIVNAMLADKQQIGYLGDMPAVVSTTKGEAGEREAGGEHRAVGRAALQRDHGPRGCAGVQVRRGGGEVARRQGRRDAARKLRGPLSCGRSSR